MMNRVIQIPLIVLISWATVCELNAQLSVPMSSSEANENTLLLNNNLHLKSLFAFRLSPQRLPDRISRPKHEVVHPEVPQWYNVDDLSFFCKWEVELEKAARIPVKFRLGSVDYVDWLEGKRHYTPQY